MLPRPVLTSSSTADLRDELSWLRARHDSGAVAPSTYSLIKRLETEIAWRQHATLTNPRLCAAFGNNTARWPGHAILIEGVKVPFKGKRVDSIRVSVPKQSKQPTPQTDDLDDGIPDFPAA